MNIQTTLDQIKQEEQELLNDPDFQDLVNDLNTPLTEEQLKMINAWAKENPKEAEACEQLANIFNRILSKKC